MPRILGFLDQNKQRKNGFLLNFTTLFIHISLFYFMPNYFNCLKT